MRAFCWRNGHAKCTEGCGSQPISRPHSDSHLCGAASFDFDSFFSLESAYRMHSSTL